MLKDRLRQARINAGLTQNEVAARLGVTESTYCGYETGKRQPDAIKIASLAKIMNVTGDYLLEIEEKAHVQTVTREITPDEAVLLDAFQNMNSEGRVVIMNLISTMAASGTYKKTSSA